MSEGETHEQYSKRIAAAREAEADRRKRADNHNSQLEKFAIEAMKAPTLVAAGGVAASLGFYSANYDHLKADGGLQIFNGILFWLFVSLLASVAAPSLAYLSQAAYWSATYAEEFQWERPFLRDTYRSIFYTGIGHICRWGAIVLVLVSLVALGRGGWEFLQIVK